MDAGWERWEERKSVKLREIQDLFKALQAINWWEWLQYGLPSPP